MEKRVGNLGKEIALPLFVGAAAGILTRGAMRGYQTMKQPFLAPPAWLFPVVWTILYILMGVSAWKIRTYEGAETEVERVLTVYKGQLAVNFLWPVFFFDFQWFLFSFFWLLFLWGLVLKMIRDFWKLSKLAAYLNLPYLLWLTFAAYLNLSVWKLN